MSGDHKQLLHTVCVIVMTLISVRVHAADPNIFTREAITPKGESYTATVPDTLDLAERAKLGVHGLTSFINTTTYWPYAVGYFNCQTPFQSDSGIPGFNNCGKLNEALIMARLMSGSTENLDVQEKMLKAVVSYIDEHGPNVPNTKNILPMSRIVAAFMALNQIQPNTELTKILEHLIDIHIQAAQIDGDTAFYISRPSSNEYPEIGFINYGDTVYQNGGAIRPLARWYAMTGDEKSLQLAEKLRNFLLKPIYWTPEAEPRTVVGSEHGHFNGWVHTYGHSLWGLLWLADVTNDARLKRFVRDSYEYYRNFGIARIGLFGESCSTADMICLAIKLSDLGVGDYWDDVDMYIRNQMAEVQITDPERLRQTVAEMPEAIPGKEVYGMELIPDDSDRVIEKHVGLFLSDGTHPTRIPPRSLLRVVCCECNPMVAMYCTWDGIVRGQGETAQINLLLNRASPWLDIDSYLPYEGKVIIRNKTARKISVRIPGWVDREAVKSEIDGEAASPFRIGNYLVFDSVKPKDTITITFPIRETTETYTLKWKDSDLWHEGTAPGVKDWAPLENPDKYTMRFRGNTLVDISPRRAGPGYPMYQRDEMKAEKAPMIELERFVSPIIPKW